MDNIPPGFTKRIGYPPHSLCGFNGQVHQPPVNHALQRPVPPQHTNASFAAPIALRNSASQMPHDAILTLAATRKTPLTDTNWPARKRITRACDQCNQLRTKCDGQQPWAHCTALEIECQYNREQKKRGKASRKDLAKRATYKNSADSGAGSGKATKPETKRTVNKSEAEIIRMSCKVPMLLLPFTPTDPSTPIKSIPDTPVRTNGGETRPSYPEHMLAYSMYGNEFALLPDDSGDGSGDLTGSEQNYNTYAGRFSHRHESISKAISNGHHLVAHAVQPESTPFQRVEKFGEEPVSMECAASH